MSEVKWLEMLQNYQQPTESDRFGSILTVYQTAEKKECIILLYINH